MGLNGGGIYISSSTQVAAGLLPGAILSQGTLTGNAASIDFNPIASGYKFFVLYFSPVISGGAHTAYMRFNADAGATYYAAWSSYNGTAVVNAKDAGGVTTGWICGSISAGYESPVTVVISNDSSARYHCYTAHNYSTMTPICYDYTGRWDGAGASEITRITLYPSADNFETGTSYVLIGYGKS